MTALSVGAMLMKFTSCILLIASALEVINATELNRGVVIEDVHIEYHPSSSLGGSMSSSGVGSFPGSYVSDWSRDWSMPAGSVGGRLNVARCVDIPANMSLCRNVGYQQMRLPNLLDHDSVAETTQQAASWVPLLNIRCHPDTQMFLCSLFAPVCLDQKIYPCRTLCQAVKDGCEARMMKYGFPWPDMLECDKFPLDNDLCIGLQNNEQRSSHDVTCSACDHPDTFESIVDNFCQSEFVMRVRIDQSSVSVVSDDVQITVNRKKIYKKGGLKAKEQKGPITFFIEDGNQCQCNSIVSPGQHQQSSKTPSASGNYLVMGSRRSDRLVLSFIQPIDRRSADQSRALSAMKHDRICKTVSVTSSGTNSSENTNKNPKKSPSQKAKQPTTVTVTSPVNENGKRKSDGNSKKNGDGKNKNKNAGRMQSHRESGKPTTKAPVAAEDNAASKVKGSRSRTSTKTRR